MLSSGYRYRGEDDRKETAFGNHSKSGLLPVIKLSEIPGLQNGKGHFTAIINKKGKVHLILYNNGAGYLGVYFHETGEYLVYKLSSKGYETSYKWYIDKVCYANEVENPESHWSKEAVLAILGITTE